MKDLVYKNNQNKKGFSSNVGSNFADVETLAKYKNNPNAVYQVVTKYDLRESGYDVSIRSTRNLDKAFEILKSEFLRERSFFCEEFGFSDDEFKPVTDMFGNEFNTLKDTYAILDFIEQIQPRNPLL